MNNTTDPVDNLSVLFNHLNSFSPIIKKTPDLLPSKLFPSRPSESFSLESLQQAISPPLQFISQNVNKSNISMHTLLNSYLLWSSNTPSISSANPCLTADIVIVIAHDFRTFFFFMSLHLLDSFTFKTPHSFIFFHTPHQDTKIIFNYSGRLARTR